MLPPPSLHHLHNLALDTRFSGISSQSPTILAATLSHIQQSSPPLTSFTIKLPEGDDQIGQEFIQQLLTAHGLTLKRLAFFTGSLAINSVLSICKACPHLERLDLPLPINQIVSLTSKHFLHLQCLTLIRFCFKLGTVHDRHRALFQLGDDR